jgi:hypothetical protein
MTTQAVIILVNDATSLLKYSLLPSSMAPLVTSNIAQHFADTFGILIRF